MGSRALKWVWGWSGWVGRDRGVNCLINSVMLDVLMLLHLMALFINLYGGLLIIILYPFR